MMSIGPLGGIAGSAAGSSLAQTSGTDTERAKQEVVDQKRQVTTDQQAAGAAGIAETDGQDHQANDRDADGRRLWEPGAQRKIASADQASDEQPPQSKDASGQCGNSVDLTG